MPGCSACEERELGDWDIGPSKKKDAMDPGKDLLSPIMDAACLSPRPSALAPTGDGGTHGKGEAPPSGSSWPIWPDTVAGQQDASQDALLAAVCKKRGRDNGSHKRPGGPETRGKGDWGGGGPAHPMPAGALTLVIEEAMAREDEPAAFPEPEPGAVLGRQSGGREGRRKGGDSDTRKQRPTEKGGAETHMRRNRFRWRTGNQWVAAEET